MFELHTNTIVGVIEARDKLKKAIVKKYPTANKSRFDIGIDPFSGKYTVVVFLSDPSVKKRLPGTVDGYKVVDGFEPFDFDEGMKNA